MPGISRREFAALATAGVAAAPFVLSRTGQAAPITAADVVERIKKNIGVDWNGESVDTFKAGDPGTAVTARTTSSRSEQREIEGTFDSPEYVMDAATLGIPKGWIVIGHNLSEESGMQEMADWLTPVVPEVKVQHVRAGLVYWAPN